MRTTRTSTALSLHDIWSPGRHGLSMPADTCDSSKQCSVFAQPRTGPAGPHHAREQAQLQLLRDGGRGHKRGAQAVLHGPLDGLHGVELLCAPEVEPVAMPLHGYKWRTRALRRAPPLRVP